MSKIKQDSEFEKIALSDDGTFPNNILPVIHYQHVLFLPALFAGPSVRHLFDIHGWFNSWSGGIFEYDHYHSNTFEVMGIISGATRLQVGGNQGKEIFIEKGDVIIIPPGVAHRNLQKEKNVTCIGAYPDGIKYNMRYGKAGERPQSDHEIQRVEIPILDPVFGTTFSASLKTRVSFEAQMQ